MARRGWRGGGWHGGLARPWRLGRRVWLGLRAWVRDRFRCALLRRLRWQPILCLWRRLRHAPPLGDQPLGSSRLALDARLLLDPLLAIRAGRPREEAGASALGRHVIDDQHADHDADQQRRQKKIFHFVDPFRLQSRTVHATENFVGVGAHRLCVVRQLTFDGRDSINSARAGTTIFRQGKGRAKPGHLPIRGSNRFGQRQLLSLCRGGDRCGRRAGGLACISGKICPGREDQCGCAGDEEDDFAFDVSLKSFGFVSLKLGVCCCTFCVQDHKKTDLIFQPSAARPSCRNPQFCPRNGPIPINRVLIKPTLNP